MTQVRKESNQRYITHQQDLSLRTFSGNDTTIGEGATTSANTSTPRFLPPGTDLHMNLGDACSLGCLPDINRCFLLVMDKGTEYFVSFFYLNSCVSTCASKTIRHPHWQKNSLLADRQC